MSDQSTEEVSSSAKADTEVMQDPEQDLKENSTKPKIIKKETQLEVKRKVDILLKATGDAPIMKTKKWSVESDRTVGSIVEFVKKYLKMNPTESLHLYVNQSFAPSPDQRILSLFECFAIEGKLVFHYCKTPAWG